MTSAPVQLGNLSAALEKEGFAIFPEMPETVVDALSKFYASLKKSDMTGFHPTLLWKDAETKKLISEEICKALQPYVQQHLPEFRLLYGSFMVKEPGENSVMKLHQDWAYVDEPEHESLAIWFPLLDLTNNNGVLSVIPRSHTFENYVRGPGVFCPFSENSSYIIEQWGYPVYLKKGQPIIWQHRLLHYSPPNISNIPRIAVTAILIPEKAKPIHFFKPEENDIVREFGVEEDFYFHYRIGDKPENNVTLIRKFEHRQTTYDRAVLQKHLSTQKPGLWGKIKARLAGI
jgi:Phytanoyl-CoA dioxygenase (PhyH)